MIYEDDFLPLSALQHLLFCERRAALIYIEGLWDDNPFTVEGSHLHERTHVSGTEVRGNMRIARGLPLRSTRLGLSGKADVVEFHRLFQDESKRLTGKSLVDGIRLDGTVGLWCPFPVEYKRGRLRQEEGYEVQLCAQSLCLEEMLNVAVPKGAIYYGKTGRRLELDFDEDLRAKTEEASQRMHNLVGLSCTPRAIYSKKCEKCSLIDFCLPKAMNRRRSVRTYLSDAIKDLREIGDETPS